MTQKYNFLVIWARVENETEISTFSKLAELVETTHQYVSRKKKKNEFPVEWAFKVAQAYGLSTDWIMTGEGPRKRSEADGINPLLAEVNEWLNEEEKQKDADFRTLFQQQMIRAFFDYEKWVKKRKRPLGSIPVNPKLRLS